MEVHFDSGCAIFAGQSSRGIVFKQTRPFDTVLEKRVNSEYKRRMRVLPLIIAASALVLFGILANPFGRAEGILGGVLSKSPIIRKAARYDLVPVTTAAPGCFIDMRYKFTSASGKPLYVKDMPCLVYKQAGKKLKAAQIEVAKQGYALKIWDAWRPAEAHIALWNAVKDPRYVVPPSKGLSWHCYGISIDLTLVKADGSPVKMPTKFDVFYQGGCLDLHGERSRD